MAQVSSGRRSEKSAAAFRTISEVAGELDVQQHVLRFWETKFSQVRPLKRGGGRRYYRPEDVLLLKRIRALLYDDGYTIKGVQRLLRDGSSLKPEAIATIKRAHTDPPAEIPPPGGTALGRTTAANDVSDAPPSDADPEPAAAPAAEAIPASNVALRAELQEILAELKALRAMLPDRSS